MAAHFEEFLMNSGVDFTSHPPVMMIPLPGNAKRAGSNFVLLVDGNGYTLSTSHKQLKVDDLRPIEHMLDDMATWPMVGRLAAAGKKLLPNVRVLEVSCSVTLGKQGGKLHAKSTGKPGHSATIDVVVLRQRKVKLAIVDVKLPDGNLLSKKPADPKALCDALNRIWTPQANVFFELVAKDPVAVDLPTDPRFRLQPEKHLSSFIKARPSGADFTIFLVRDVGTAHGSTWSVSSGRTIADHAVAFIPDYGRGLGDGERTIAHEAGHWLGAFNAKGSFIRYPDHLEMRSTHLMTQGDDGGNGLKISLRETDKVNPDESKNKGTLERFNRNYSN